MNDRNGHAAGDELLRDLVASLRAELRPYDPVVRWGGDEFLCAISGADPDDVRARFESIRATFAGEGGPQVTIGVAPLKEGDTFETLLDRADSALLEARHVRDAAARYSPQAAEEAEDASGAETSRGTEGG